jgi:hypothetical protein
VGKDRYVLDLDQIAQLLHHFTDLYLKYEYEQGYDEPRARLAAIRDIIEALRAQED